LSKSNALPSSILQLQRSSQAKPAAPFHHHNAMLSAIQAAITMCQHQPRPIWDFSIYKCAQKEMQNLANEQNETTEVESELWREW
jgi:hypothetical protein